MGLENGDECVIPPQDLLERFKDYGQEQTLAYWHDLTPEERDVLIQDLELVDLPRVSRIVRKSMRKQDKLNVQPVLDPEVATLEIRTQDERGRWWGMGLRAISEGKLAVLLLSGGQGTRLGSKDPKGCFNIGLPSGKSLFQLQAERILRVQKLASQSSTNGKVVKVPWYIMTSPFTDSATKKFFQNRKYFGLEQDQVMFFQQGTLPCISKDGRFIMSNPYKMAMAPDGNGGVYAALKSSRYLEDMARRGIKYVDVYSVDNTLVRVADPLFLGYWIEQGTACAAKVIKKAYPQERVGVFVHHGKGGPVGVAEYTELGADLQFAINQETGRLLYKWSNVCMHMFTLDFLNTVVEELEKDSMSVKNNYVSFSPMLSLRSTWIGTISIFRYHLAEKKIPSVDGVIDGLKLEQFIFDSIPYAPSISLFEVIREEEFAPVKNASGSTTDSPDTARALLQRLHMGWVVSAGGSIANTGTAYASGVEVSPLLSYAGEGLEDLCRGRTFHASTEIHA